MWRTGRNGAVSSGPGVFDLKPSRADRGRGKQPGALEPADFGLSANGRDVLYSCMNSPARRSILVGDLL